MQPAVAVGDGVRLVAGVDQRALQRGLEPDLDLEEVAALGDLVAGVRESTPMPDPARPAHHLAHDEERRPGGARCPANGVERAIR